MRKSLRKKACEKKTDAGSRLRPLPTPDTHKCTALDNRVDYSKNVQQKSLRYVRYYTSSHQCRNVDTGGWNAPKHRKISLKKHTETSVFFPKEKTCHELKISPTSGARHKGLVIRSKSEKFNRPLNSQLKNKNGILQARHVSNEMFLFQVLLRLCNYYIWITHKTYALVHQNTEIKKPNAEKTVWFGLSALPQGEVLTTNAASTELRPRQNGEGLQQKLDLIGNWLSTYCAPVRQYCCNKQWISASGMSDDLCV